MALLPGARLGPYEILTPLGAGGMGEVYKARDTRLDRTVAIKLLPSDVAQDPDLRARFEREARAIAALDHPNICPIYDVGEAPNPAPGILNPEPVRYFVMQYLEGETLAARLARAKGPLPLEDVLKVGVEIAGALDKAHRAGITHRDLKPANIMLTKAGAARQGSPQAKLLDFGLAKLRGPAAPISMSGMTRLATVTSIDRTHGGPNTAHGTILGTVHYMSPEQVEGHEADARSDIWALGAVIYEMATGKRPFNGESPASVIGAILKDTPPPVSSSQPLSPPTLDHIVGRCLEKDPDERWQTSADVKRELAWIAGAAPSAARAAARPRAASVWIASTALLTVALIAAAPAAIRHLRESPARQKVVRLSVSAPPNTAFASTNGTVPSTQLAISPDGRRLAFIASVSGKRPLLWIQRLDEVDARSIPGTEDASLPFWSPDSRMIAFFARGKLFKIDAAGGSPQKICDVGSGRGGTWSRDDIIVFASISINGLARVPAGGGSPVPVTTLNIVRKEASHRFPQFLPDGRRFLFLVRSEQPEVRGIYLGSLDSTETKRLFSTNRQATYDAAGFLLFVLEGLLFAQPLTPGSAPSGDAIQVASNVGGSTTGYASLSTSDDGVLAFAGTNSQIGRLTWYDRTGHVLGTVGATGDYVNFEISPDQKRLALSLVDTQLNTPDLWLHDVARGTSLRLTSDPATDASPRWAPDGGRIVFRSDRSGNTDLFLKSAGGTGPDEPFLSDAGLKIPSDWSPDGAYVVYHVVKENTGQDIWVVPMSGDHKARVFLQTPFNEMQGRLSPDGRWLAYTSDESGNLEVYVRPFPTGAEKWLVSTSGGSDAVWRRDGKELFYLGADRKLMSVSVKSGAAFESDVPKPLFDAHVGALNPDYRNQYAVSNDGSRFLVNVVSEGSASSPITVVLNWTELLKK